MHKRGMIILTIFALFLAALPLYHFLILPNLPNRIDWTMYASVVRSDGTPVKGEEYDIEQFTVSGFINKKRDGTAEMNLRIVMPETFRYMYNNKNRKSDTSEYISINRKYTDEPYYMMNCYTYDRIANGGDFTYIGLSDEMEYMIFSWEDGEDLFLVASTDANLGSDEIMEYFRQFRETYTVED